MGLQVLGGLTLVLELGAQEGQLRGLCQEAAPGDVLVVAVCAKLPRQDLQMNLRCLRISNTNVSRTNNANRARVRELSRNSE